MGPASCRQFLKVQNHGATLGSDCNRVLSHCQSQSSKVLAALCHVIEYVSTYELCTKDMNISLFYLMNVYLYVFVYLHVHRICMDMHHMYVMDMQKYNFTIAEIRRENRRHGGTGAV